jgi:sialate O-acetylesterase
MAKYILSAEYAADFSVSRVFADDMVVQRNEHIRVWGFAPESENGKKVSGEFKGLFAESLIENGEWCLTFGEKLDADIKGAQMRIFTDKKEIVFKDVLVGDVYMVIGQSNTEYSVNSHFIYCDPVTQGGGKDAIDPDSLVRLNRNNNSSGGDFTERGTAYVYKDLQNQKQWTKTTVEDTLPFSAIAYFFARDMAERLENKVPVGVIEAGFSGAPLGAFLPNEIAEKYNTDTVNAQTGKFLTTGMNSHVYEGRYIYNCHLAPFEKFAIAGMVWFQGTSDYEDSNASRYVEVFAAYMEYMRNTHNLVNRDYPIFVVEYSSVFPKPVGYNGSERWQYIDIGLIRSIIGGVNLSIKNCYVSAAGDLWRDKEHANNIHSHCKYEQAKRLAGIVDNIVCHNGTLEAAMGPILESYEFSEDQHTAILTFSNVGEGLATCNGETRVQGIKVYPAKFVGMRAEEPVWAEIVSKNQIKVTHNKAIKAVGYNAVAEDLHGETMNLCNSEGAISSAFNTGYVMNYFAEDKMFSSADFIEKETETAKLKKFALDSVCVDDVRYSSSDLAGASYTVDCNENAKKLTFRGWTGFENEIVCFGYSIDGENAVLGSIPVNAEESVKKTAGEAAKRYDVNVNIDGMKAGNHTVSLLAIVSDSKNEHEANAVKLVRITVIIRT